MWPSDRLKPAGKTHWDVCLMESGFGFFDKLYCNSGRLMKSVVSQAALCFQGCQTQQKTLNCGAIVSSASQEEAEIVCGGALGQVPSQLCESS